MSRRPVSRDWVLWTSLAAAMLIAWGQARDVNRLAVESGYGPLTRTELVGSFSVSAVFWFVPLYVILRLARRLVRWAHRGPRQLPPNAQEHQPADPATGHDTA